jgi:hypothetical protein
VLLDLSCRYPDNLIQIENVAGSDLSVNPSRLDILIQLLDKWRSFPFTPFE